jgi:peptidoglycan/xylan/chitin deacetylase (PgdA/CDA1 family)
LYVDRRIATAFAPVGRWVWRNAPVILIYHRVAEPARDVWGLAVGPDRFAEQIEALTRTRRVLPLGELAAAAATGKRYDRPLAAVTFDDGCFDAFTTARPVLQRFDCPATVFVVTGMVDAKKEFWWDEVAFIFIETARLPATLDMTFGQETVHWTFSDGDGPRIGACHYLRRFLLGQPPSEIEACLERLRAWAGVERPARASHRAMSSGEVAELDDGLISVGAHTVSHPSLPALSPAEQRTEIVESARACEALTGRRPTYFAYPFGRYDAASWAATREAGFAGACATIPGAVKAADPFRLPRIAPGLMDGEALARALS